MDTETVKRANPCDTIAAQWVTLRRHGQGKVGPCPICSANPQSRTATRFEVWSDRWVCAVCQDGGDVIALVQRRRGCSFAEAVEFLGGTVTAPSPRERAAAAERTAKRARAAQDAEHYRQKEIDTLRGIWARAQALPGSVAESYLRLRGITAPIGAVALRCVPDMPYYHAATVIGRAPAMVAMIEREGALTGLHFTYIDLGRPNGKAAFADAEGVALPAKKCRGHVAGGHIALVATATRPRRLVIGEGIETVLSVWRLGDAGDTAYWCGVSLGNIGGASLAPIRHPTLRDAAGRPRRVPGPLPDLDKPGILVPAGLAEAVLLRDGDSEPLLTEMALQRGAVRLYRQDVGRVVIAAAPDGRDFNDAWSGDDREEQP